MPYIRKGYSPAPAGPDLDALSDADLIALAKERGLKGVPSRWSRDTLVRKLKEVI